MSKTEKNFVSKEYVFKAEAAGHLTFIGDFEGLYQSDENPWGQRGDDARLNGYYQFSRTNLIRNVAAVQKKIGANVDILEVGSGLGYVSSQIDQELSGQGSVNGLDISPTAVARAQKNFPHLKFSAGDIGSNDLKLSKKYDIVIMVEVLWYVLERLPQVFKNIEGLLKPNGYLIFSNGFPPEQRYGREIVDGFDGLVKYVLTHHFDQFKIIKAEADYSGRFIFDDGVLVLQRK